MRKINLFIMLFVVVLSGSTFAESSLSVNLGMDFFNYREIFLDTGITYNFDLTEGMEGNIGADFAIWPEGPAEAKVASLFIPVNLGLNFTFAKQVPTFLVGVGLTPIFKVKGGDSLGFYLGPYLKGGLRLKVHQVMSWIVEVQQDLSFGGPEIINTTTRVTTGINFSLAPVKKAGSKD
ncbi:MAG: hypothetical protein DRP87_13180 [Spirochaetes bacterium]|nr:MAG: hypothetical protein DRP87_13180 [Spirochaetota bacterium]